jgi:hypothetical protein
VRDQSARGGKPSRRGQALWNAIAGSTRGLANALNALDILVLVLVLVALPFVYFARCVGIVDDGGAKSVGSTPTIGPVEPPEDSP